MGLIAILPAIFMRFLWLGEVPGGINYDEADAIQTAKSYLYFGTDPFGNKFPLTIIKNSVETADDTLLSLLLVPWYRLLPMTPAGLRLPMAVINLLTAIVLAGIGYQLSRSKLLSGILLFVFMYSPWAIVYARSITQAPLALLLMLLAIWLWIKKKGLLGGVFILLGFLSYYGAKPIAIALALILPIAFRANKKQAAAWAGIIGIGIGLYFWAAIAIPGSTFFHRQGEVKITDMGQYGRSVDEQRRMAIASPAEELFVNKIEIMLKQAVTRYMKYWSPDVFYISGDINANTRFDDHGLAYIHEIFLWGVGLAAAGQFPALALLAAVLSIIGPIGTAINIWSVQLTWRGFLYMPGWMLFAALGILLIYKKYKIAGIRILGVIYIFMISNFFYFYFFRSPITTGEANFQSERVVANYAIRNPGKTIIVASQPVQIYQQMAIFSGQRKNELIANTNTLQWGNATITNSCPKEIGNEAIIVMAKANCPGISETGKLVIQDQRDTGTVWKIFNDKWCRPYVTDRYRREHLRSDYDIEIMANDSFCNRWVAQI